MISGFVIRAAKPGDLVDEPDAALSVLPSTPGGGTGISSFRQTFFSPGPEIPHWRRKIATRSDQTPRTVSTTHFDLFHRDAMGRR